MKTEFKLAEALKTMMSEVSLDSISVTALSKKCHINRQTFYYHFDDIYDLLTFVFLYEKIDRLSDTKNMRSLVNKIYEYYTANKGFVDATLNSAGKELFQEFVYNACYQSVLKFVLAFPDAKKLHVNDRKSVARFYASAYSNCIVYYLSTFKNKSIEGLQNCFVFESDNSLEKTIDRLSKVRGLK